MRDGSPSNRSPFFFKSLLCFLALFLLNAVCISMLRGDGAWLYLDFVSYTNIYWGDDAYRWFLARSAWSDADLYWFNFSLPLWLVLDGLIATLSGGGLLDARYLKAAINAGSILFFFYTCINIGVSRWVAICTALLLACMPLYLLVGMSFYGEAWQAFLVSLSMFLISRGSRKSSLAVISMMPLVHPEGFFISMAAAVFGFFRKNLYEVVAPIFLGFVFFISIFLFSPSPSDFFTWRELAAEFYREQGSFYGWGGISLADVFFIPWLIGSCLGMLNKKSQALRIFYCGATAALGISLLSVLRREAFFEPRYYVPLLPVLMVGFGVFVDSLYAAFVRNGFKKTGRATATIFFITVFLFQLSSLTTIRRLLTSGFEEGRGLTYFLSDEGRNAFPYSMSTSEKNKLKDYADVVISMLEKNPEITFLFVGNVQAFYFLDPDRIDASVKIVVPVFDHSQTKHFMRQEAVAGYFGESPYFSYFSLADPSWGKEKILYLGRFDLPGYPYHWKVGGSVIGGDNEIYLFSGGYVNKNSAMMKFRSVDGAYE